MPTEKKLITICLPVYNGEKKLPASLAELKSLDQDLCEIHILDNASTDYTYTLASQWAQREKNIFVHRYTENIGQPGNFNRCRQFATTTYFAWLGAGDVPLSGYYERCINWLRHHPECALCYSDDATGRTLESYEDDRWQARIMKYFAFPGLGNINFGVMRSSLLKKLMPWFYLLGNDHILQLNVLLYGIIHKISSPLFKRDWPTERSFDAYLRTCTAGNSSQELYCTTRFRSLDMLWGYLQLGKHFFLAECEQQEFCELIYNNFYIPLKDIIDERIIIVKQCLQSASNLNLLCQLELLEDFIQFRCLN